MTQEQIRAAMMAIHEVLRTHTENPAEAMPVLVNTFAYLHCSYGTAPLDDVLDAFAQEVRIAVESNQIKGHA